MTDREPWSDGIDMKGLWTYTGHDRFSRVAHRNDVLWYEIVKARIGLMQAALAWREAAMRDGWTSKPTYPGHESELTAFHLDREGFTVLGLARPASATMLGTGSITCWGPDGLQIKVGEVYDWQAIQDGLQTCGYCYKTDVSTQRVGFAGRCCAQCLEPMRRAIETPGWTE